MKKILMSAVAMIFAAGAVSAQGPLFLGGGIGFTQEKFGDAKTTAFTVSPQIGYMLNENFGIALDFGYSSIKNNENEDLVDVTESSFGVGLSGIYKLKITDNFYYAPTLRVGFESQKLEVDVDGAEALKATEIGVGLEALRFEFRPSANWGFNFGFGGIDFTNNKVKDADDATTAFSIGLLQGATIGFNYYF